MDTLPSWQTWVAVEAAAGGLGRLALRETTGGLLGDYWPWDWEPMSRAMANQTGRQSGPR